MSSLHEEIAKFISYLHTIFHCVISIFHWNNIFWGNLFNKKEKPPFNIQPPFHSNNLLCNSSSYIQPPCSSLFLHLAWRTHGMPTLLIGLLVITCPTFWYCSQLNYLSFLISKVILIIKVLKLNIAVIVWIKQIFIILFAWMN